jgi:type II secretory pathway component PulF
MSEAAQPAAKPISLSDLIAFNEEVLALVRVGLPIEIGLGGTQLPKSIRKITRRFREELERGATIRQALDNCGAEFPASYLALVEAGLRSNRLTDSLISAGEFARTVLSMQHQLRSALVYPLLIFSVAYGFFLLLVSELVPRIIGLLSMSGGSPRGFLKVLELLSEHVSSWGPVVPAALVLAGLVSGFIPLPWLRPPSAVLGQIHRFPWVGRIIRDSQSAGFCRLLGILVDREVPLPLSLELASASTGDIQLTSECLRIAADVRHGTPLNTALKTATRLPAFTRWMLATGNDQGGLAAVMVTLADIYRRRAESQRQLFAISAPLILTIAIGGAAVGAYALLVFVPMRDLFMQIVSGPVR